MDISIIICTRNNAESLKDTLESLLHQEGCERLDYQVIVVDNNSTDNTKAAVTEYVPKFNGRLSYALEEKKGNPFARNLGISIAKGRIIAFTDDDCIVDSRYLSRIHENFSKCGDEVAFMGGKIIPKWVNCTRPEWMRDFFLPNLAMLDYGDQAFTIDGKSEQRMVYGANFAFRSEAFRKHGPFRTERTYTQDIEICQRLLQAGQKGFYAPDVKVHHKVTPDRAKKKYFYNWYYKKGKMRDLDCEIKSKKYHLLGVPLWLWMGTYKHLVQSFFSKSEFEAVKNRCFFWSNVSLIGARIKKNIF